MNIFCNMLPLANTSARSRQSYHASHFTPSPNITINSRIVSSLIVIFWSTRSDFPLFPLLKTVFSTQIYHASTSQLAENRLGCHSQLFLHPNLFSCHCVFVYEHRFQHIKKKSLATSYSRRANPTTFGNKELNFCVRHGYRCVLFFIITRLFFLF